MKIVLFKGFKKVGTFLNVEEARKKIVGPGIWNICKITDNEGYQRIIDRETIVK